jgi:hypothetical protein
VTYARWSVPRSSRWRRESRTQTRTWSNLLPTETVAWAGLFQGTQLAIQLETARAFEQHLRQQLPVQGEPAAEKGEPEPRDSPYL